MERENGTTTIDRDQQEIDAATRLAREAADIPERTQPSSLDLLNPEQLEQCLKLADLMSAMSLLPDHLRFEGSGQNKKALSTEQIRANCFRIVNQALRWQVDPFALLDCTYVVGGKLGYEGKLVAAIVNTRGGLDTQLNYEFSGSGNDRTVTVSAVINGEIKTVELKFKDAVTYGKDGKQSAQWTRDPDQKLCYSGATKWARRHCPQVILGILTDDDVDKIAAEEPKAEAKRKRVFIGQDEQPEKTHEPEQPKKEPIDMDAFAEHVYACKTLAALDKAEKALDGKELTEEQGFACNEYLRIARERLAK